jgi:hypothetical protein
VPQSANPHRFTDNYTVHVTDGEAAYEENGWRVTAQWRLGTPGKLNSGSLDHWTNGAGETKPVLGEEFVALLPRLTKGIAARRRVMVVPHNPAGTGEFDLAFHYEVLPDFRGEQITYREKDREITMFWGSMTSHSIEARDIDFWRPVGPTPPNFVRVDITPLVRAAILDRVVAYMMENHRTKVHPA